MRELWGWTLSGGGEGHDRKTEDPVVADAD